MTNLIQTLISGLSLGSIYALIALGYTMVYGIAKMLNFAHGDVIMVGAYSGIVAVAQLGLSPWVTVIVSIVVCAVLGVVIEFCAYKPLRQAAPLSVLITAIGVSYLLQNAALLLFGSQQMAYPTLVKLGSFSVGGVQVDGITVLTLAVTAVLMAALTLFIDKTKLGKAMRAVSEDKDAATLMGISVDRTITLTFAIGSALAAFASMFYGMTYVYIKPTTGAMPGIKTFYKNFTISIRYNFCRSKACCFSFIGCCLTVYAVSFVYNINLCICICCIASFVCFIKLEFCICQSSLSLIF